MRENTPWINVFLQQTTNESVYSLPASLLLIIFASTKPQQKSQRKIAAGIPNFKCAASI